MTIYGHFLYNLYIFGKNLKAVLDQKTVIMNSVTVKKSVCVLHSGKAKIRLCLPLLNQQLCWMLQVYQKAQGFKDHDLTLGLGYFQFHFLTS